jgi:type II secretory pathway predicted ATPase ExeA
MVLDYYNLKEEPFGVTPDPRFLYSSPSHREALASLQYGIRSRRGFLSLIAEPGMGKTTILFELLRQLEGSARTVFLFQTLCSPKELLRGLLRDLGVSVDNEDVGSLQEQLNHVLLTEARHGRRVVVVIDEAQNLEDRALELLRMLSNFETATYKLMQIVLAGQPQLRERLSSPHQVQLRQRMAIFSRLRTLTAEETQHYLYHRLHIAGYRRNASLFTPEAKALIATYSGGIPRNINNICFNALALGYVLRKKRIGEEVVRESLEDLDLEPQQVMPSKTKSESCVPAISIPTPPLDQGQRLPWLTRATTCVIVLLTLLCFSGDGKGANHSAVPHQTNATHSAVAGSSELVNSPVVGSLDNAGPRTPAKVAISQSRSLAPNAVSSQAKVANELPHVEPVVDPGKLWEEVGQQNTDAEVMLARLYLEGTSVPKSCEQAQVLLQAASRKGNVRAKDLLQSYQEDCR